MKYDAFISYSHSDCGNIAPAIQRALENIGKPWYQLKRNLNIFRDETNLTASPELWNSIVTELDNSDNLILLASPIAKDSHWVAKEIEHWFSKERTGNLYIVVSQGQIVWDYSTNDFSWKKTNCLPLTLKNRFIDEPLWIDLTNYHQAETKTINYKQAGFTSSMTKVIGGIVGKPPREIESEELTRKRKISFALLASTLLLFSLIFIGYTYYNQNYISTQIAISNSLIAEGNIERESDINAAFFNYYKAYKNYPTETGFKILNDFYKSKKIENSIRLENSDIKLTEFSLFIKKTKNIDGSDSTNIYNEEGQQQLFQGFLDNQFFRIHQNELTFYKSNDNSMSSKFIIPKGVTYYDSDNRYILFESSKNGFPFQYLDSLSIVIFDSKTKLFVKILPNKIVKSKYKTIQIALSNNKIIFFSKNFEDNDYRFSFLLTLYDINNKTIKNYTIDDNRESLAWNFENVSISPNNKFLYFNTHLHNRMDYTQSFLLNLDKTSIIYKTDAINNDYDKDISVVETKFISDSVFIESRNDGSFQLYDFKNNHSFSTTEYLNNIQNFVCADNLIFAVNENNELYIFTYNIDSYVEDRRFMNEIFLVSNQQLPFSSYIEAISYDTKQKAVLFCNSLSEIYRLEKKEPLNLNPKISELEKQVNSIFGLYNKN